MSLRSYSLIFVDGVLVLLLLESITLGEEVGARDIDDRILIGTFRGCRYELDLLHATAAAVGFRRTFGRRLDRLEFAKAVFIVENEFRFRCRQCGFGDDLATAFIATRAAVVMRIEAAAERLQGEVNVECIIRWISPELIVLIR